MPRQTFHNLPSEKKKRILDAAIREFSEKCFAESSIATMVRAAGISRGSFYQYFADKLDLYRHVFHVLRDTKLAYFEKPLSEAREKGFFETFRAMVHAGFSYAAEHPAHLAIGQQFLMENEEFKKAILEEYADQGIGLYRHLLSCGLEKGEIREGINLDLWARLLFHLLNQSVYSFVDLEEISRSSHEILDVLRYGLARREGDVT